MLLSVEGQKYEVVANIDNGPFNEGDIVVAIESNTEIPWVVLANEYVEGWSRDMYTLNGIPYDLYDVNEELKEVEEEEHS